MADPAFRGFVETTYDALLIFEGCRQGLLPKITRRLQEFEKRQQVVSGAVFVFDEEETGIKRWTDGLSWSPSRTLGNFLVYRELDKKGGAGTADDHASAADTSDAFDDPPAAPDASGSAGPVASGSGASTSRRRSLSDAGGGVVPPMDRARERALVGSLTSTYRFRADGLVKKTISLAGLHMIGYYKIDDVTGARLRSPSSHSELTILDIDESFLTASFFRMPPITEVGADGKQHFKAEADTPMSPLIRSGSSQGFSTPALGSSRSRPQSSDSTSVGPVSPRVAPLNLATSSQRDRDLSAPGSPHRSSASGRRDSRYDPYSGRTSPGLSSSYSNSGAAYPFPSGPHSPNRSSFSPAPTPGPTDDPTFRNVDLAGSAPLSPVMSSSAPPSGPHPHGPNWAPQLSLGLTRLPGDPGGPTSSAFYQPRHATPFSPSDAPSPSGSGASSATGAVFAFQPPPPATSRLSQRPPGRASPPPLPYQSYSTSFPPSHLNLNPNANPNLSLSQHHHPLPPQPGRPASAQYQPQQQPSAFSAIQGRPYTPPHPSGPYPPPQPSGSSSSFPALGRPGPGGSSSRGSGEYQPPPLHQHSQFQSSAYGYSNPSTSAPASYHYPTTYPPIDQRVSSGMVMGLSAASDDEPPLGLGLSEDLGAGDARGRMVKEEAPDDADQWRWHSNTPQPSWPPGGKTGYP